MTKITSAPTTKKTPAKSTSRRRLSPENRIASILDATAKVVTEEGLSAVTMERIGQEADISKGLVYNYFPDRIEVLAALLERELAITNEEAFDATVMAEDFEHMVRLTNRIYLKHMRDQGALLQRLAADPAVVKIVEQKRRAPKAITNRYLLEQVQENYGLPTNIGKFVIDLAAGLTAAAAKHVYEQNDIEFQIAEDICVDMTMAGLEVLASKHRVD